LKSGRQIRFFTSTDNSTYNNSLNLNSDGSATFGGVVSLPDGSASAPSITNTGDTHTGIYFLANDTLAFSTGGVQRGYFSGSGNIEWASGNLSIGTINSGAITSTAGIGGTTGQFSSTVGIRQTSPSVDLHIGDAATGVDAILRLESGGGSKASKILLTDEGSSAWEIRKAGTSHNLEFYGYGSSTNVLSLDTSGNATFGGTITSLGITATGNSAVIGDMRISGDITGGNPTTGSYFIDNAVGSKTAPSYSFYNDTDTGMYRDGADNLAFATNGGMRLVIDSVGKATFAGQITAPTIDIAGHCLFGDGATTMPATYAAYSHARFGKMGMISGRDVVDPVVSFGCNFYENPDGILKYLESSFSNRIKFQDGYFDYEYAPSGTGGETLTFASALHINTSGNARFAGKVGINGTPTKKLQIFDDSSSVLTMFQIKQGGAPNGDASMAFTVPDTSWAIGIDNTDDCFKISNTLDDVGNLNWFKIATSGAATFGGDIIGNANLILVSTDAGAGEQPVLTLKRDSASPDNGDLIGMLEFKGEDTMSASETYADITGKIEECTHSIEGGSLRFRTMKAGTLTDTFELDRGNATFAGDVTMNGGSGDYEAGARLAVYTKGASGQPALHLDSGGNGDGLHIETGNNAYASNQYAIKCFDQNSATVVFGVKKSNTVEADDIYEMSMNGAATFAGGITVTQSFSYGNRPLILNNGTAETGTSYDMLVINSNDAPTIRLNETGSNQELTINVGDENVNSGQIGVTGKLVFSTNRSAGATGYDQESNTIALTLDTSQNATFAGYVKSTEFIGERFFLSGRVDYRDDMAEMFVPINGGSGPVTSLTVGNRYKDGYYWIVPFNCTLDYIQLVSEKASLGDTKITVDYVGISSNYETTVDIILADVVYEFAFDYDLSKGAMLYMAIDPTNKAESMAYTLVFVTR